MALSRWFLRLLGSMSKLGGRNGALTLHERSARVDERSTLPRVQPDVTRPVRLCETAKERNATAMKIAMRVLTAHTQRRRPDHNDLKELRQLAPPLAEAPPAELAVEVICQLLKTRFERRLQPARA
jgi:hypothetical protein